MPGTLSGRTLIDPFTTTVVTGGAKSGPGSDAPQADQPGSPADEDNRERLRAFRAEVAHREAMHRLADELKAAFTVIELGQIVAVMNRVGDEYEAWLRAETVRLQARNDWREARLSDANAIASAMPSAG